MQLRRHSFLEACLNTASGFVVSFTATFVVFPWMLGVQTTIEENFWITVFFTVISVIRSYLWRRAFNYLEARKEAKRIRIIGLSRNELLDELFIGGDGEGI